MQAVISSTSATFTYGYAIPIRDFNPGANLLYASYLIGWIVFGTVGLPTLVAGILVLAGIGLPFFRAFTDIINAVANLLVVLYNVGLGMVMWFVLMLIWTINTEACHKYLTANIKMR